MCYKTGQVYLLTTPSIAFLDFFGTSKYNILTFYGGEIMKGFSVSSNRFFRTMPLLALLLACLLGMAACGGSSTTTTTGGGTGAGISGSGG